MIRFIMSIYEKEWHDIYWGKDGRNLFKIVGMWTKKAVKSISEEGGIDSLDFYEER